MRNEINKNVPIFIVNAQSAEKKMERLIDFLLE